MMAAISAAYTASAHKRDARIILLERNHSPGRKLLITGQGRCNITHTGSVEDLIEKFFHGGKFLRDALTMFSNKNLLSFFKQHGLGLVAGPDGRYFPKTDKALDVLAVLEKVMRHVGIEMTIDTRCTDILTEDGKVQGVKCGKVTFPADAVVLATGGNTYRVTGSTGDGYRLAADCGHQVKRPSPALLGLPVLEPRLGSLQGIVLQDIMLTVRASGRKLCSSRGDMLITQNGVSGPAVLSVSGHVCALLADKTAVTLEVDLLPEYTETGLNDWLSQKGKTHTKRTLKVFLRSLLPERFTEFLLRVVAVDGEKHIPDMSKHQQRALINGLKHFPLRVDASIEYDLGMVTRGGVSLKEVDPRTMESRLVKGLYFAGEVLDIDADTGGYNLQAAFSTGWLAGISVLKTDAGSGVQDVGRSTKEREN